MQEIPRRLAQNLKETEEESLANEIDTRTEIDDRYLKIIYLLHMVLTKTESSRGCQSGCPTSGRLTAGHKLKPLKSPISFVPVQPEVFQKLCLTSSSF